jgi:hypothetical protein
MAAARTDATVEAQTRYANAGQRRQRGAGDLGLAPCPMSILFDRAR